MLFILVKNAAECLWSVIKAAFQQKEKNPVIGLTLKSFIFAPSLTTSVEKFIPHLQMVQHLVQLSILLYNFFNFLLKMVKARICYLNIEKVHLGLSNLLRKRLFFSLKIYSNI